MVRVCAPSGTERHLVMYILTREHQFHMLFTSHLHVNYVVIVFCCYRCAFLFGLYVCFIYGPDLDDPTFDMKAKTKSFIGSSSQGNNREGDIMSKVLLTLLFFLLLHL